MARQQIVGGGFQDAAGNALNGGYLKVQLTVDASDGTDQIAAGKVITLQLDSSGSISGTQYLWPNNLLQPSGTKYVVTAYNAKGQRCWGPSSQTVPSGGSPYDITAWVPGE